MLDFVNVINLRRYIALMRSIFLDRPLASAGVCCLSNVGSRNALKYCLDRPLASAGVCCLSNVGSRNALKYCLRAIVSGLYGSSLVL